MNLLCLNGNFLPDSSPVLKASNRSYRYGAGLFETIRIAEGTIPLADYHFERLFQGISTLKFRPPVHFSQEKLKKEILELCGKNNCEASARARLSVSAGNGNLQDIDSELEYIIECNPLHEKETVLNKKGLEIGIYQGISKPSGNLSNLKTSSSLPYVMAAAHCRENGLDDCLVLNTAGNITDSTIANIFIIRGDKIITPSLEEGCVAGVYRRYLLEKRLRIADLGYQLVESAIDIPDLTSAEEIFLTNAVRGVNWVEKFQDTRYGSRQVELIYASVLADRKIS